MKKKIALVMMMMATAGFSLSGCGDEDKTATQESVSAVESTTETASASNTAAANTIDTSTLNTEGSLSGLNCADYVTIGEYKGLEVSVKEPVVTDEDVDTTINDYISYYMSEENLITEGSVKEGDTVRIDYVGTKDGVAFDGGTAEGYDLTIGSGAFIPGFEDGLVGVTVGETVTLDLTFPETYSNNPDLAGQLTQFEVTVHAIVETTVPELTEDMVEELAGYMAVEATDIASLRTAVYDQLYEAQVSAADEEAGFQVQEAAYANMTVTDTPEFLKNRLYIRMDSNYNYYAYMYSSYGYTEITDAPSYLYYMYGVDPADYSTYLMDMAADYANQYVGFQQIAELEGLLVTDEEAMTEIENEYANYGYESVEAFLELVTLDEYKDDMMFERVLQFLTENANVVYTE